MIPGIIWLRWVELLDRQMGKKTVLPPRILWIHTFPVSMATYWMMHSGLIFVGGGLHLFRYEGPVLYALWMILWFIVGILLMHINLHRAAHPGEEEETGMVESIAWTTVTLIGIGVWFGTVILLYGLILLIVWLTR